MPETTLQLSPFIRATDRHGDWVAVEIWLPVPLDAPNDVAYLPAFARFDGRRLIEWTTRPPACYPVAETPNRESYEPFGSPECQLPASCLQECVQLVGKEPIADLDRDALAQTIPVPVPLSS